MKLGLVLSGGGVKGAAHIGVIKALEEYNIYPSVISGTSAGAIVGALYAGGYKWQEILHFFKAVPMFQFSRYALGKPGILDSEKYYVDFKKYFPEDNFAALKKPLYVTATDIINGSLTYFNKGNLIKPILASASFPGVFTPVEINGKHYIDGGVLNNFPVEPLKDKCHKIIGVYVTPLKKVAISDLKHSYQVVDRAYKVKSASDCIAKFSDCDVIFYPEELANYSTFSVGNIDTIFNIGYLHAKQQLKTRNIVID